MGRNGDYCTIEVLAAVGTSFPTSSCQLLSPHIFPAFAFFCPNNALLLDTNDVHPMRSVAAIVDDLNNFEFDSAAEERLATLADELDDHPGALAAIPALRMLFEKYPGKYFGTPGPLAHVVEKWYRSGYEDILEASLQRHPTSLTVWLANRIANARDENCERFVSLLRGIGSRHDLDHQVREEALHFAGLHQ